MRMRVVWHKFSKRYKFICRNKILPGPKSQWNEPPSHSPSIPSFRQITILSHLFERLGVLWSQVTSATALSLSFSAELSFMAEWPHLSVHFLTFHSLLNPHPSHDHSWHSAKFNKIPTIGNSMDTLSLGCLTSLDNRPCLCGPASHLFFFPLVKSCFYSWIYGDSFSVSFKNAGTVSVGVCLCPSSMCFTR